MATHNNWVRTNIQERQFNITLPFDVHITPYQFRKLCFEDASNNVVKLIQEKDKKIYVGLSGGLDSEYVAKCFLENKVDFVPVLVLTKSNLLESSHAIHFCKKYNIRPTIIKTPISELIRTYENEIFSRFGGDGVNSVFSVIAAKYANDNGGIYVNGDGVIDEKDYRIYESDVYNDAIYGEDLSHYFFLYTPDIVYSQTQIKYDDVQEFKFNLYGIPYRPKYESSRLEYQKYVRILSDKLPRIKRYYSFRNEMLEQYLT